MTAANALEKEWWDGAIRRCIRGFWHLVGLYLVTVNVASSVARATVMGDVPVFLGVGSPALIAFVVGLLSAAALTVLRPGLSSARTLGFGVLATVLFRGMLIPFVGDPTALSGNPMVTADILLVALSALSLSAAVAFGYGHGSHHPSEKDDTGGAQE